MELVGLESDVINHSEVRARTSSDYLDLLNCKLTQLCRERATVIRLSARLPE